MTITLPQAEYWDLFQELVLNDQTPLDEFETIWRYPEQLGQGFWRRMCLREGVILEIGNYQQLKPFVLEVPDREHPLEYSFILEKQTDQQPIAISAGESFFSGSGFAPAEQSLQQPGEKLLELSIHIDPDVFRSTVSDPSQDSQSFQKLLRASDQERFVDYMAPTVAMQMTLQQILQCPYRGAIKRLYLESKVWELMALQLESILNNPFNSDNTGQMSADDVERIHHAKEILAQHLDNPPSLKTLARQVGLNEFALKQGFRKVLGTTAFGYLHQYRMERARQLLEAGEMSVTQVAHKVGFTNRGYFAATFRKQFGINPKLYATTAKRVS